MVQSWIVAALLCVVVQAQALQTITVPFTLHGMHIYLKCAINNMPVTMVLDSGAGANVITPQGAQKLGLKPGAGSGVAVGAGGQPTAVKVVTLASLDVGEARSEKQPAYIIPLPDALPCDGLLGTPFFRQWIVTIDYVESKIILTPKGQYTPPADAVEFPVEFVSETVHVLATVDGHSGLFKIDTGAGDTLTLFAQFVDKNGMRSKYMPSIKMVTGRGVGGLIYGDAVRLPVFSVGPFEFKGVAATLSRQTQGAFADSRLAGNIGEAILQRFTVTFDHTSKKLYLSKNSQYDKPFLGNRSGLATDYVRGSIFVRSVIDPSPASEAGIREGDTIVSIEDKAADSLMPWELRDLLNAEVGSKVRLKVRTGTEIPREVSLTLRELF